MDGDLAYSKRLYTMPSSGPTITPCKRPYSVELFMTPPWVLR